MHNFYFATPTEPTGEFLFLGKGLNSVVYRKGPDVFKLSRRTRSKADAERAAQRQITEYDRTAHYLGELVVPTTYHVMRHEMRPERFVVVSRQPYVEGIQIGEADADKINYDPLVTMYQSALAMYRETGDIPDLACIERGLFDPLQSPNVLVDSSGTPLLVDPNPGKLQGSKAFGGLWNRWIAQSVASTLAEL